jgi:hypothetical protein
MLRGDGRLFDDGPTLRTLRRHWRLVGFIDLRRHRTMRFPTIRGTSLAAGALGMGRERLRERCGLPEPRAARLVQLPFQMVDLLAQAIIFPLHPIVLALRLIALALGALGPFPPALAPAGRPFFRRRVAVIRHAIVMPESSPKYKCTRSARGQDPLTRYGGRSSEDWTLLESCEHAVRKSLRCVFLIEEGGRVRRFGGGLLPRLSQSGHERSSRISRFVSCGIPRSQMNQGRSSNRVAMLQRPRRQHVRSNITVQAPR